jgi:putative nucleotidyltransferase with HDIG domain
MNLLSILAQQASIAIDNARTYMTLNELHQGFIRTFLEAMDSRDEYSHSHSVFVSCLCRRIAEEMALSAETVATLEQAALLHDLGKIAIPETILKKPGKLSEEEKSIVALHPVTAARILEKMELFKNLVPIILHQSERWDGKGKPRGLRSEEIPMGSRILCVAEAFDALISRRAYREAYSVEEAIEILLGGSGSLFDPNVLQALLALLKREPELRNRWVQEAQTAGRV